MTGKWNSDVFGMIEAGDKDRMRDVIEEIFNGGDLRGDFKDYVRNNYDLVDDFVNEGGELSGEYEDVVSDFISEKVGDFCEGDDVEIGGYDFAWVDEPKRNIVMMVKLTITDMDMDVHEKVKTFVNENICPDDWSMEIIKDEKEEGSE